MPLEEIAYEPYTDPEEFIREVTDFIWVDRAIGYIRQNYEPDSVVHTSLGTINGRDDVISGSLMRQAYGANRIGQAEDVVWEARGDDAFLSSHLVFGAGADLPHMSRTIANCLYRRGRMVEEWVVRDTLAAALQEGLDPDVLAAAVAFVGYTGSMTQPAPVDVLAAGDSGPRSDDYRPEAQLVLEFVERVWNGRELEKVHDFMIRDLFLHDVGYRTWIRPEGYKRSLLRLLAPFPTASFEVRDLQTNYDERYGGLRIAVLWKLVGDYIGVPDFGPLTGARTELLGVSQFLVQRGRIVKEYRVYDQIALRAQINAGRGEQPYLKINIY
ncbi:MAG TPA: ester cyclase [Propionibacteriaceae bacterium]|nr:ester cyclase [Propionibacteriaceae bacterium]